MDRLYGCFCNPSTSETERRRGQRWEPRGQEGPGEGPDTCYRLGFLAARTIGVAPSLNYTLALRYPLYQDQSDVRSYSDWSAKGGLPDSITVGRVVLYNR